MAVYVPVWLYPWLQSVSIDDRLDYFWSFAATENVAMNNLVSVTFNTCADESVG